LKQHKPFFDKEHSELLDHWSRFNCSGCI